ncbi:hypothetical protein AK812_SmicGene40469 [Symbiodinium microadriaticum]|uniref:Isochorismatase-like domain-containing protein n=1 Tax=Symbiodinium microadriaticum TaxID=2951 RepID=A0A1Q9C8K8_SYMMI|nr:hypothetical protein AK812_SmicGene40469 [Symbiodinium microadriaticum]
MGARSLSSGSAQFSIQTSDVCRRLAKSLGIHDLPPDEAVQVLWWSKVLIDDPLRICRALRFAAKFKFKLHPAFWKAAPFALERGAVLHMFVSGDYRIYRNFCRRACILALGILSPGFGSCGLYRKPGILARTSHGMAAAEEAPVPTPKAALLLIDLQKAFTVGSWASHFGGKMQVADIERACVETARLLESGKVPPDTAILCTKCYDSMPHDEPYVDVVEPFLRKVPCIHKPTMDVTYNPAFFRWLQQQVRCGVNVLIIGGCTTTSCVRVSSTEIASQLAEQGLAGKIRVVVDLNLCGARSENFEKTADRDPVLVRIYGCEFCQGKSAVDLAIVQMNRAGVEVIERDAGGWQW